MGYAGKSTKFTADPLTAFNRYGADLSVMWIRLEFHRAGEHQGQSEIKQETSSSKAANRHGVEGGQVCRLFQ
jgi:hypothetical protein